MTSADGTMTTEFVVVPGASLWTASRGAGVPLALAHGGPGLSSNLQPMAAMVEDIARVHLYDQRGSGRSSTGGPWEVETFVADLDALRDHWGHERWIVGGHSWGAVLALFYAFAHPERTLGVIYLAGTAIRWGFHDRVRAERMSRLMAGEQEELEMLAGRLREGGEQADQDRFLRLMWSTDFATREAAGVLDREPLYEFPRAEEVARAVQKDWKARFEAGIEEDLRGLRVPVLVLHGDRDPDPVGAQEVADLAPFGEWAPLAAAGHSPWLEQPSAMRARLRAFIRPIAAPSERAADGATARRAAGPFTG
jgi:proline iminopeptidase